MADELLIPSKSELLSMRALISSSLERVRSWPQFSRRPPVVSSDSFTDGRRKPAEKWKSCWPYPGGLGLNFPRQKSLSPKALTRRTNKTLARRASYLAYTAKL